MSTGFLLLRHVRTIAMAALFASLPYTAAQAQSSTNPASIFSGVLQQVLREHPSVMGQRAQINAKSFGVAAAQALRYPSVSGNFSQSVNSDSTSAISLRARQPLLDFGRVDSQTALASRALSIEDVAFIRVQRDLIENTAVAYARVLTARQRMHIAERNTLQMNQLLAQIERRYTGQVASQADVELAQARQAQAQTQLDRLTAEWLLAQNELQALTQSKTTVADDLGLLQLQWPDVAGVIQLGMQNHAQILVKQQQAELAKLQIDHVKKLAMPTLYVQIEQNVRSNGNHGSPQVGLAVEGGLENLGFGTRSKADEAAALYRVAQAEVVSTQNEIRRQITAHWHNRQVALEQAQAQTQSTKTLETLVASYQRQYNAGTKNWIDVLNMQKELIEQQLQTAQAAGDLHIYNLRLAAMTGSLDRFAGLELSREQP